MDKALEEAIEAFRPIAEARNWHTQEGSFQWCGDASEEFIKCAQEKGLEARYEWFDGLPPEAADAIARLGSPSLIDEGETTHVVVTVDGVYVDWTARQFYPDKPFPTIWTLEELNAAGWFCEEGK